MRNKYLEVINAMEIKAYRTNVIRTESIVFSTSRGKARAATMRAAKEAGYNIFFTDISCRRCKNLDDKKGNCKENICYQPEHVVYIIKEK